MARITLYNRNWSFQSGGHCFLFVCNSRLQPFDDFSISHFNFWKPPRCSNVNFFLTMVLVLLVEDSICEGSDGVVGHISSSMTIWNQGHFDFCWMILCLWWWWWWWWCLSMFLTIHWQGTIERANWFRPYKVFFFNLMWISSSHAFMHGVFLFCGGSAGQTRGCATAGGNGVKSCPPSMIDFWGTYFAWKFLQYIWFIRFYYSLHVCLYYKRNTYIIIIRIYIYTYIKYDHKTDNIHWRVL